MSMTPDDWDKYYQFVTNNRMADWHEALDDLARVIRQRNYRVLWYWSIGAKSAFEAHIQYHEQRVARAEYRLWCLENRVPVSNHYRNEDWD